MFRAILAHLTPDSTLNDLPYHNFQVDISTIGKTIIDNFQEKPEIPGVIVRKENNKIVGVICRKKFAEKMSQPYSLELFLKRPISSLSDIINNQPLQLSHTCTIAEAALRALDRSANYIYEPIVVNYDNEEVALINIHILLLAQSHILNLVNNLIQTEKEKNQQYSEKLSKEKEKVKKYAQMLESRQVEINQRNQLLENQQEQLIHQYREIADLNEKFIQVSQMLSLEGKQAFQRAFDNANNLNHNANKIISTSKALAKDLETINYLTQLIDKISKQVKILGVRAAIVANQQSGEKSNFSQIVTEISNLGNQTFEANNKVTQIANYFKVRMQQLTECARVEEVSVQSLIENVKQAQISLSKLEDLVNYQKVDEIALVSNG